MSKSGLREDYGKFLLDTYFKEKSFVKHNIKSFNDFLENGIQRVVDSFEYIEPDLAPEGCEEFKVKLGKIWVEQPTFRGASGAVRDITPTEARIRDLTYDAPIYLEMTPVRDGELGEKRTVKIGKMPIMLKSEKCRLANKSRDELIEMGEDPKDPGGYFIINGTERCIVMIENLAPNKIFVSEQSHGKYEYIAKVYSQKGRYTIPHSLNLQDDGVITVSFARAKNIPFAILMKALGFLEDNEIVEAVSAGEKYESDLYINLYEADEIPSREEALDRCSKKMNINMEREKRIDKAEDTLNRYLFPHLGRDGKNQKDKGYFLAKAVKRLLLVSQGEAEKMDKDHYGNKRIRLPGPLMESLFRYAFNILTSDFNYNFERIVKRGGNPKLQGVVRSKFFTSRIESSLATGEWVGNRHGVSQHMSRDNFFATISHLRRVVSLLSAHRKNFRARDLHPTHWGKLGTHETPEGTNIGLRKALAITAEVSKEPEIDEESFVSKLEKIGLETE